MNRRLAKHVYQLYIRKENDRRPKKTTQQLRKSTIVTNENCRCRKKKKKQRISNATHRQKQRCNGRQPAVFENNSGKPLQRVNGRDVTNKRSRVIGIKGSGKQGKSIV